MAGIDEVWIKQSAVEAIAAATIRGYEARGKEERLGILLGRRTDGRAVVHRAIEYRARRRSRTAVLVDPGSFDRRVRELRRQFRMRFLGTWHSHVEVAGSVSTRLSTEDRRPLAGDLDPRLELVVGIWSGHGVPVESRYYFQGRVNGYRFRIVSRVRGKRFRIVPTACPDLGDGLGAGDGPVGGHWDPGASWSP